MYSDLREKLVQEAKEEFEALKLANKDVKKMKRKKTHKFANNSEIGARSSSWDFLRHKRKERCMPVQFIPASTV